MATKKAAESTLYHLSPKGFWKTFRDNVAVNPAISSGLPLQGVVRYPPPASRPEKYNTPASKASDPAENPYWKRDVRRAYPKLSVVTQNELSSLLIEHSSAKAVQAPTEGAKEGETAVATPREALELSAAISTIAESGKVFSESKLPPKITHAHPRWIPETAEPAPHAKYAHFPMSLYK